MRKIVLMALTALPLFAGFFPQTTHTSISRITNKSITLVNSFPVNGMTGIVIHNYGNNAEAISSRIIQNNSEKITLLDNDIMHHDKLPTINTSVKPGDKVIGGYLYDNVLVLAPDARIYKNFTSIHHKTWIHPDLFALFLAKIGENTPTKKNLKAFANSYQVGLVCIIGHNGAKLLDPISGRIIGQESVVGLPRKGKAPFFMNFDEIASSMFSSSKHLGYYKLMDTL